MKTLAALSEYSTHELQLELITRKMTEADDRIRDMEVSLAAARSNQANRLVEWNRLHTLVYATNPPADADLGRTVTIPQDATPVPLS